MAKLPQIRGMLLEEALLNLLKVSGYNTVEEANPNDKTLQRGSAGLEVRGRGGKHQIDAIADLALNLPFCYPQRLLVEAKCLAGPVGIEVVRNAVGVLKDVSEYWVTQKSGIPPKPRYHYQYAVFSATDYTIDAEKYAFAQDIYLIPLAKSKYIQPIIRAIKNLTSTTFGAKTAQAAIAIDMTAFRQAVRKKLAERDFDTPLSVNNKSYEGLKNFFAKCQNINQGLLAIIDKRFPLFLVPEPGFDVRNLESDYKVRIRYKEKAWYLEAYKWYGKPDIRFSFDLPDELFELYAEQGVLTPQQVFNIKTSNLSQIQALVSDNNSIKVMNFSLDQEWLEEIRYQLKENTKNSRDKREI